MGQQLPTEPSPQWRVIFATVSIVLLTLCLCVMVLAVRGRRDGSPSALLRGLSRIPLFGRLVRPLLATPTPEAPAIMVVVPSPAPTSTPVPNQYLVRPSNWPTDWPWPPRPRTPAP